MNLDEFLLNILNVLDSCTVKNDDNERGNDEDEIKAMRNCIRYKTY